MCNLPCTFPQSSFKLTSPLKRHRWIEIWFLHSCLGFFLLYFRKILGHQNEAYGVHLRFSCTQWFIIFLYWAHQYCIEFPVHTFYYSVENSKNSKFSYLTSQEIRNCKRKKCSAAAFRRTNCFMKKENLLQDKAVPCSPPELYLFQKLPCEKCGSHGLKRICMCMY